MSIAGDSHWFDWNPYKRSTGRRGPRVSCLSNVFLFLCFYTQKTTPIANARRRTHTPLKRTNEWNPIQFTSSLGESEWQRYIINIFLYIVTTLLCCMEVFDILMRHVYIVDIKCVKNPWGKKWKIVFLPNTVTSSSV